MARYKYGKNYNKEGIHVTATQGQLEGIGEHRPLYLDAGDYKHVVRLNIEGDETVLEPDQARPTIPKGGELVYRTVSEVQLEALLSGEALLHLSHEDTKHDVTLGLKGNEDGKFHNHRGTIAGASLS